jgi:hypothetical protein
MPPGRAPGPSEPPGPRTGARERAEAAAGPPRASSGGLKPPLAGWWPRATCPILGETTAGEKDGKPHWNGRRPRRAGDGAPARHLPSREVPWVTASGPVSASESRCKPSRHWPTFPGADRPIADWALAARPLPRLGMYRQRTTKITNAQITRADPRTSPP